MEDCHGFIEVASRANRTPDANSLGDIMYDYNNKTALQTIVSLLEQDNMIPGINKKGYRKIALFIAKDVLKNEA
jgi:hypothetical protein